MRPVGGECGGLVAVPGFDSPWGVLSGDERRAVGLPAELPRDGVPRYHIVVGGLGRSEPPLRLPRFRLNDRQPGVARLGDEFPAALGDRAPDEPADPPGAVPPCQLNELVAARVDVDADGEQPCPGDADGPRPITLEGMDAIWRDDVRLGDDIRLRQRGVSQAGDEFDATSLRDLADAVRIEDLVCLVLCGGRVGVGLLGRPPQVIDH